MSVLSRGVGFLETAHAQDGRMLGAGLDDGQAADALVIEAPGPTFTVGAGDTLYIPAESFPPEPLLQWERFIHLIGQARDELPQTAVHVLTNGRAFSSPEITRAWAGVGHPNLMAGIPIYSAIDHVHDYVVQAAGAFDETVLGILRLKDQGQRIEIRVVLHQITVPRIVETARWLARNLPFVDHIALMGLENTGFAIANHDLLWIDPIDYKRDLALAVDILDAAGVNVSIYNLPYCVLDRSVWPFAKQSISDWKNAYLPQCDECQAKSQCAGFFSSGRPRNSRAIESLAVFDLAR
jgi:His-Xaa-Ser system radical SAM maturase HxsC